MDTGCADTVYCVEGFAQNPLFYQFAAYDVCRAVYDVFGGYSGHDKFLSFLDDST